MSDLENRVASFGNDLRAAATQFERDFFQAISPLLPFALVFCNDEGQVHLEAEQTRCIFGGESVTRYTEITEDVAYFSFVSVLREYLSTVKKAKARDALLVSRANETGFEFLRLQGYSDYGYFITTIDQAGFLSRLDFVVEEKAILQQLARQTHDKVWEYYDHYRKEFFAAGLHPSALHSEFRALDDLQFSTDCLSIQIERILKQLQRS